MQLHKDKLYSMKEVDSEAVMWLVAIWSEKCEDHLRAKAAVAKRLSYRIPPIPFNSSLSG